MISRRSALLLGEIYEQGFSHSDYETFPNHPGGFHLYKIETDTLYDFLFERNYPVWFCNGAKAIKSNKRELKEFVMRLQTGETQMKVTPNWEWKDREKLGQATLRSLSEDILAVQPDTRRKVHERVSGFQAGLQSSLQLDGYVCADGRLLIPESDVLNKREDAGVLDSLYFELRLGEREIAFQHLGLSEKHYLEKHWADSIRSSRKFLECVLAQITLRMALPVGLPVRGDSADQPIQIWDSLERANLLERSENEALVKVYRLLNATGGHPYMAEEDQARLLRHLALTFTQFVMLRLKGRLSSSGV